MNQLYCPLWGISSLGMESCQFVVDGEGLGSLGLLLGGQATCLVPNQVNWTRQAAIVVRSRSAGVALSVPVRPLVDRVSMRSIKVLILPPEKRKADQVSALENGFCPWSRELESTVRLSQEGYQRLAVLSG